MNTDLDTETQECFENRKREHIEKSLDPSSQATDMGGFEKVYLAHEALPDLNFEEIKLNTVSFGKKIKTPFFISGITAGHQKATQINSIIGCACQKRGWAMGVGSQRRELSSDKNEWESFRNKFKDLEIFSNIGVTQLISSPISDIKKIVKNLKAQALVVHTNPLQEVLQKEGTPNFKGGLLALEKVCNELDVPVVLKETGCGFSKNTLNRIKDLKLTALDVSGLGGTHWGRVEGGRASKNSILRNAAQSYKNWGEPTVSSLYFALKILPQNVELWGSGGVRSGLDAAKLLALGASRVGYAQPALKEALKGEQALLEWMELQEFELRVALFCTGSSSINDLQVKGCIVYGGEALSEE